MRISKIIMLVAIVGCLLGSIMWAQGEKTQASQINKYFDAIRKDLRTERQGLVDQAMALEAADKVKFWSVYEKYQAEGKTLWDQRFANIMKYSENIDNMTDAVADELAMKAMDIEAQRTALRKKYYQQVKNVLGARIAARFLQAEVMIDHLYDLQIGAEIPLIK